MADVVGINGQPLADDNPVRNTELIDMGNWIAGIGRDGHQDGARARAVFVVISYDDGGLQAAWSDHRGLSDLETVGALSLLQDKFLKVRDTPGDDQ